MVIADYFFPDRLMGQFLFIVTVMVDINMKVSQTISFWIHPSLRFITNKEVRLDVNLPNTSSVFTNTAQKEFIRYDLSLALK